ncbi:LmrA/YxaF family transcription factor [Nocardiopsis flavescens]
MPYLEQPPAFVARTGSERGTTPTGSRPPVPGPLEGSLREHGVPDGEAGEVAALAVAAAEGAVALCRARRTTDALDAVEARLGALIRAATAGRP